MHDVFMTVQDEDYDYTVCDADDILTNVMSSLRLKWHVASNGTTVG